MTSSCVAFVSQYFLIGVTCVVITILALQNTTINFIKTSDTFLTATVCGITAVSATITVLICQSVCKRNKQRFRYDVIFFPTKNHCGICFSTHECFDHSLSFLAVLHQISVVAYNLTLYMRVIKCVMNLLVFGCCLGWFVKRKHNHFETVEI